MIQCECCLVYVSVCVSCDLRLTLQNLLQWGWKDTELMRERARGRKCVRKSSCILLSWLSVNSCVRWACVCVCARLCTEYDVVHEGKCTFLTCHLFSTDNFRNRGSADRVCVLSDCTVMRWRRRRSPGQGRQGETRGSEETAFTMPFFRGNGALLCSSMRCSLTLLGEGMCSL